MCFNAIRENNILAKISENRGFIPTLCVQVAFCSDETMRLCVYTGSFRLAFDGRIYDKYQNKYVCD